MALKLESFKQKAFIPLEFLWLCGLGMAGVWDSIINSHASVWSRCPLGCSFLHWGMSASQSLCWNWQHPVPYSLWLWACLLLSVRWVEVDLRFLLSRLHGAAHNWKAELSQQVWRQWQRVSKVSADPVPVAKPPYFCDVSFQRNRLSGQPIIWKIP